MFLQKIELENLLSFKHLELELRPLNVLIGANATGKSNLVRVLTLVRALPKDFGAEIAKGGGPSGWINQRTGGTAGIDLLWHAFRYAISFRQTGQSLKIGYERAAMFRESTSPLLLFERTEDQLRLGPITGHENHGFSSP